MCRSYYSVWEQFPQGFGIVQWFVLADTCFSHSCLPLASSGVGRLAKLIPRRSQEPKRVKNRSRTCGLAWLLNHVKSYCVTYELVVFNIIRHYSTQAVLSVLMWKHFSRAVYLSFEAARGTFDSARLALDLTLWYACPWMTRARQGPSQLEILGAGRF